MPVLSKSKIIFIISTLIFSVFSFSSDALAQYPFIDDFDDRISSRESDEPSTHNISFTLPINADPVNSTDYINLQFLYYSDLTVPQSMTGLITGTPSFSVVGDTVKITDASIPPGGEVNIDGITTTNPSSPHFFAYIVTMRICEDANCNSLKAAASVIPTEWDGRINLSATVGYATGEMQIDGYGPPLSYLIFNEDSNTLGTSVVGSNGAYSKLFTGVPPGTHSMSFFGIDTSNRNTSTISVDIPTAAYQKSTIVNQLLSPTIEVSDISIDLGEPIYATGTAFPTSDVTLFTDSPLRSYSTTADVTGNWSYTITNSSSYAPGDYRLYAIAQAGGALQSLFSPAILFTINATPASTGGTACGDISEADLNCDGSVNLADFSILMFYWSTDSDAADTNNDGIVGLTDLSVMMYFWGS